MGYLYRPRLKDAEPHVSTPRVRCTIRLEPGTTKNDDGRLVYLTPELVELFQAQEERIQLLEMDLGHKVPYLFPHLSGEHKGKRIHDFGKRWKTACLNAMLEGLEGEERTQQKAELQAAIARKEKPGLLKMIRHDFRRTAVRNLVNRGVPERVAMRSRATRPAPYSTATTS